MFPGQTGHVTGQMGRVPGTDGRTPGGVPPKFFMFIGFFSFPVVCFTDKRLLQLRLGATWEINLHHRGFRYRYGRYGVNSSSDIMSTVGLDGAEFPSEGFFVLLSSWWWWWSIILNSLCKPERSCDFWCTSPSAETSLINLARLVSKDLRVENWIALRQSVQYGYKFERVYNGVLPNLAQEALFSTPHLTASTIKVKHGSEKGIRMTLLLRRKG